MVVLHALWDGADEGRLLFWIERPQRTRTTLNQRSPNRHPGARGHAALIHAAGQCVGASLATRARPSRRTLLLPTVSGAPHPSPELEATPHDALGLRWQPWTIPTLTLSNPTLALQRLARAELPGNMALGASARFWLAAGAFVDELIARRAFAPYAGDDDMTLLARWSPVFDANASAHMRALAAAMPGVCRAIVPNDAGADAAQHSTPDALPLLAQFVERLLDNRVRRLLRPVMFPVVTDADRTPATRWLRKLIGRSKSAYLPVRTVDDHLFGEAVRAWLAPFHVLPEARGRLCIQLDEPSEDIADSHWHLSYFIQDVDEPSVLIPVRHIWHASGRDAVIAQRRFIDAHQVLLTDLARAGTVSPLVADTLRQPTPNGAALTVEQAHAFLREQASALEAADIGVRLPAWSKRKLKVELSIPDPDHIAYFGVDTLLKFNWQAALGDMVLTRAEFETLSRLKTPLAQVRGQWVEVNADNLKRALRYFDRNKDGLTVAEAVRVAANGADDDLGLNVSKVDAKGRVRELLERLRGSRRISAVKPAQTFSGTLRPYQERGLSWLAYLSEYGLGACLADDMGLGKCVLPQTLVFVNGTLKPIEQLWKEHATDVHSDGEGMWATPTSTLNVNSIDETTGQIVSSTVRALYRQHICEPVRRITLDDGSVINITRSHKLLTRDGWTNNLQAGDVVCVPARLVFEGAPEDPDLVTFVAWQIAEGHEQTQRATLRISQKDESVLHGLNQTIVRLSERYCFNVNRPAVRRWKTKTPDLIMTSRAYQSFLQSKGYVWGHLSRDKVIPDFIMQSDSQSVRLFLRNYFEAEGSVAPRAKIVEISSASSVLIQQLSTLLRRFGIWLRVSTKRKRATNGDGVFRDYYFGIMGGNSVRRFLREIGFAGERKQKLLEHICETSSNTNVEGIPASDLFAEAITTTGLPTRHFGVPNNVYVTGSQEFSRVSLGRALSGVTRILTGEAEEAFRQKKTSKWTTKTLDAYAHLDHDYLSNLQHRLQTMLDRDVHYCSIKTIEDVQHEGWVYDLEVERHHNFVANNILCHNTVQLLAVVEHWRANDKAPGPVLLVCPMSIVGNWQREAARFAPKLKVLVHHGPERTQDKAFGEAAGKHDLVLTTYALAHRDVKTLRCVQWRAVVLDEAQNVKNHESKQARAVRALPARQRIALTGTPVENRLSELWSIMDFLNPGFLGSHESFQVRYARGIERGDAERAASLRRLMQPFLLRRMKTDKTIIEDLPDKVEHTVYCNLTREQATLYQAVTRNMLERIADAVGLERARLILTALMKLKQVCNHPAHYLGDGSRLSGRSGKLARLEAMLEEALSAGDKALIFTQYTAMAAPLQRYLHERFGREVLYLHGGVGQRKRDEMVWRFQEAQSGPPIFVLSLKAGGTGLNLTAANHVFHFDRWWNPAVENQATDRAYRIGQLRNVQVHKLVCLGTLEERIDQLLQKKRALADAIVQDGEAWMNELSTNQLRDLFTLGAEAVGD